MFNFDPMAGVERPSKMSQITTQILTVDALAAWSESKIKAAEKCYLHFYLKYIAKLKENRTSILGTEGQIMTDSGLAAHQILETLSLNPSMQISTAFDNIRKDFIETLPGEVWDDKVLSLYQSISNFQDKIKAFGLKYPIRAQRTEMKVAVDRDYNPVSFFSKNAYFRGIMDLALDLENEDAIILDHKKGPPVEAFRYFKPQLDNYKVLFHKGIRPVNFAVSGVNFIQAGAVKLNGKSSAKEIENCLIPQLENRMEDAVSAIIRQGYFARNPKSSLCKYCGYEPECKGGCLEDYVRGSEITTEDLVQGSEGGVATSEKISVVKIYQRPKGFDPDRDIEGKPWSPVPSKKISLDGLD